MSLRRYTIPVGTDKWFVAGETETAFFEDMGVIAFESMEPADLFVNDERIANDLEAEIAARREQGPDAPPAATRDQELAEAIVAGEEG